MAKDHEKHGRHDRGQDEPTAGNYAGADLTGSQFDGATLDGSGMTDVSAKGCNFTGAVMRDGNFTNVDFTGSNFTGATGLPGQPTTEPTPGLDGIAEQQRSDR